VHIFYGLAWDIKNLLLLNVSTPLKKEHTSRKRYWLVKE
jgi:hypothetical protein